MSTISKNYTLFKMLLVKTAILCVSECFLVLMLFAIPAIVQGGNYIIISDTQIPRVGSTGGEAPVGNRFQAYFSSAHGNGMGASKYFNKAMRDYIINLPQDIKGIIINGDLTEFGHNKQLDAFQDIWGDNNKRKDKASLMLGLGNHDYKRNVDDCGTRWLLTWNDCAYKSLELMQWYTRHEITNQGLSIDWSGTSSMTDLHKRGSYSYSWSNDGVHFVQMQLNPSYSKLIETGWNNPLPDINITEGWKWLEKDLEAAIKRGEHIFIMVHDYSIATFPETEKKMKALGDKYPISGIFAGHIHDSLGKIRELKTKLNTVPVFRSGAVFYGTGFLLKLNTAGKTYDLEVIRVFDKKTVSEADQIRIQNVGGPAVGFNYEFKNEKLR